MTKLEVQCRIAFLSYNNKLKSHLCDNAVLSLILTSDTFNLANVTKVTLFTKWTQSIILWR